MFWWEPIWYTGYAGFAVFVYVKWTRPMGNPQHDAEIEAQRRFLERGGQMGYPLPPDYRKV